MYDLGVLYAKSIEPLSSGTPVARAGCPHRHTDSMYTLGFLFARLMKPPRPARTGWSGAAADGDTEAMCRLGALHHN